MALIPAPTAVSPDGVRIDTPATAATSSMTLANSGAVMLLVKNGGVSSINATLVSTKTIPDGGTAALAVADRVVAVPAGQELVIGPFSRDIYNDANGIMTINFSDVTDVLVQALSFSPAAT